MPPAGTLPFTRYSFVKVKPGKGPEYRKAWEKYNKPIFDKLAADGTILAFGLAVEEVRTDGDFTHYTWIATKDLASQDKVRAAFLGDREKRSPEEQEAITHLFTEPHRSGRGTNGTHPFLDLPFAKPEVTEIQLLVRGLRLPSEAVLFSRAR